jgi:hypothetical protein
MRLSIFYIKTYQILHIVLLRFEFILDATTLQEYKLGKCAG